ncbi:putative transcriptional regulator, GntR family protein [Frondihabitans sucicola]|uniref:Transcriptional regulator, GntR family protein n=1 Tax=Frondihabitans sucicola TaxID=1268041 RepID=A0ABM8GK77_9MICO|nr:GntR family transcriptional regulator [Frondihabitans sucicola]BDZ48795.1 putative transcriptional regulator, GntR family protein [Frondihabitans sucicola]
MPVPVPATQTPAPRRLLRDVVYDKMFAAIIDGTLELGERLNDDELVNWLGVSRTPVREAIAKLADQALVDIEANRYTRVIQPTYDEFVDTLQTGYDVWSLVVRRGVPALSSAQKKEVGTILANRSKAFASHKQEDIDALVRMNDIFLEASASSSLSRLWAATGPRILLLVRRTSALGMYPWEPAVTFTDALRKAVEAGDGSTAGDLVSGQTATFGDYFDEVRANGLFPTNPVRH